LSAFVRYASFIQQLMVEQQDSSLCQAPAIADTEWIEASSLCRSQLGRPRCTVAVPREDRAPATRRRAPWRARSYAGATQYPCAGHRSGRPPVAPSTTPLHPGPVTQDSPAWPRGHGAQCIVTSRSRHTMYCNGPLGPL
jgi:hypothetical protein